MSSQVSGDPVRVGRLGRPNGLDGFIGVYVEPEDLVYLEPGSEILIGDTVHVVRGLRRGKKGHQVAFESVPDRDAAEAIRGSDVLATQRRDLAEHEFWPHQLIGLEVRPNGGKVTEVIHGAAQDRIAIERNGQRAEIPFVDELVPVVEVDAGYIELVEVDGLFNGDIDS